ncbi:hypothetical protein SO802_021251 [Lithocarpus litseifolius]|uniref:Uncharacterized protein n=1 Tax=Lithocarpus litseifolius TaxID=425828 RepID=A0AAW2CHU4_9ROSI
MDGVSLPSTMVRQMWKHNLLKEFDLIRIAGMTHRMVAFDIEFPGVVFSPVNIDKDNVGATKIIQLRLALCDDKGSLPNFGTKYQYAWEFNFRDFDVYNDIQNMESIELLKSQGINFDKNLKEGIDSADFAALMLKSGLLGNHFAFAWVTCHGAYDVAHLMKLLIQQPLPYNLMGFMNLVQCLLVKRLFDLKHMTKFCDGLYGGLQMGANRLWVERVAGKSHQASSDT